MVSDKPVLNDVPMPIRTPRLLIRPRQEGDGEFTLVAIRESWDELHKWMSWAEDLKLIGEALNLSKDQLAHVSNLSVGEAVVSLTRLQNPILVQVDAGSVLGLEKRDLSLVEES